MALTIENGQIVSGTDTSKATASTTNTTSKDANSISADTFLTLLVAEMQNQDPLEPTDNTEWVSQYATFTQVQEISEIKETVDNNSAYDLVGKSVIVVDDSSSTGYTTGVVDYVTEEDGELVMSIGDNLYPVSDLDSVVSADYLEAVSLSLTFEAVMNALPDADSVTSDYTDAVAAAREAYDSMTTYQKTFIASSYVTKLTELEAALEKLAASEETTEETSDTTDTTDTE